MNPLTNTKNQTKMNKRELELGMSGTVASWHYQFRNSAWIFIGGLNYDLTEGDILTVFSQYGEIVNLNLVRDKVTGKAKGFAFLCYENQQSTVLAVDNFNGVKLLGRTIRVDHVNDYKVPKDDDDEEDEVKKLVRKEGCGPEVRVEKLSKKINKIKKSKDDMHKNAINNDWRINKEVDNNDDIDNSRKDLKTYDKDQAESKNLKKQKNHNDDNDKSKGVQIKEEKDDGDYNTSALVTSLQTKIKNEKEVVSSKSSKRCHAVDNRSDTEKSRNEHSEKSRVKHNVKSRDRYNDKPRDKRYDVARDNDRYTDKSSDKNNDSFYNKYNDKHSSKKIKEDSSKVEEKSKERTKYDHDKNFENLNSLKYNDNKTEKENKYKKHKGNDYDNDKAYKKYNKDRGEDKKRDKNYRH